MIRVSAQRFNSNDGLEVSVHAVAQVAALDHAQTARYLTRLRRAGIAEAVWADMPGKTCDIVVPIVVPDLGALGNEQLEVALGTPVALYQHRISRYISHRFSVRDEGD